MAIMKGRKLAKLIFERDDYQARWAKLVKRVKIQTKQIADLEAQVKSLQSAQAQDSLGHQIRFNKYERLMTYCNLNRPDVLKLLKAVEKQDARAHAGVLKPINVTIKTRKHGPHIEGL